MTFVWPKYTNDEADAVKEVLLSNKVNYWTGDKCVTFEHEFARFVGTRFAVAVSNGTTALDLCLIALNVREGDEVIVTSRTFLASVSAIVNRGAVPVFADVSLDSQNITTDSIERVITPKSRAVICVHLAGWPCDMDPITRLAKQHGLMVIEDCAQGHGARYKGRSVGSFGDMAAWSFCQDKIISTGGEGGMVTTNDHKLWSRAWSYKDHGKSWNAVHKLEHPPGFRWVHESFGTNWRMTEVQAAIGLIQLRKLGSWSQKRLANAEKIWRVARELKGLRVPQVTCDACCSDCSCRHAAYKCYVFVEGTETDRNAIMESINDQGVPCSSGSCSEVYLEKAFDQTEMRPRERLTNARKLGETSLAFACHPALTDHELNKTCDVIASVIGRYFGGNSQR